MTDIAVSAAAQDFASTSVTVAPRSEAGRRLFTIAFGAGAQAAELRKSGLADFLDFVTASRLAWFVDPDLQSIEELP